VNLASFAIRRPILVTCTVLLILVLGFVSMMRLPVDHMPDVSFPVVLVTSPYPGAGPKEVEMLLTKPIEDNLSTLSGLKRLTSINKEGVSFVVAEFTMETSDK
jgi:HAE1 family hydrophobic/amphiphilic exporter-1